MALIKEIEGIPLIKPIKISYHFNGYRWIVDFYDSPILISSQSECKRTAKNWLIANIKQFYQNVCLGSSDNLYDSLYSPQEMLDKKRKFAEYVPVNTYNIETEISEKLLEKFKIKKEQSIKMQMEFAKSCSSCMGSDIFEHKT